MKPGCAALKSSPAGVSTKTVWRSWSARGRRSLALVSAAQSMAPTTPRIWTWHTSWSGTREKGESSFPQERSFSRVPDQLVCQVQMRGVVGAIDCAADTKASDRRPRADQLLQTVFVETPAGEDFNAAQPGFIQHLPSLAREADQVS